MNVKQLKKSTTEPDKTKCVCVGGDQSWKSLQRTNSDKGKFSSSALNHWMDASCDDLPM